jgi:hypothetical protein
MKILASRIAKELKKAKHCAVYEPELSRVWPRDGNRRKAAVAQFAKRHGWRLRYYKDGFCAIFDKEPSCWNQPISVLYLGCGIPRSLREIDAASIFALSEFVDVRDSFNRLWLSAQSVHP